MAKTANAYLGRLGEVAITISAANVTAIAAFTTAEEIVIDGAVKSFRQVTTPALEVIEDFVTGDSSPIISVPDHLGHEEWELILLDDYHEGAAGEWGTDNLAAVEIFEELLAARQHPGGLQCTPAGGATGDIETTLVTPKILSVGQPEIDTATSELARVAVRIACASHTKASHA